MRHILIFFVRLYQRSFGLLFPRVCRFEPTCSQYAIDALREHGLCKGLALSVWRIVRCNPLSPGGWDPVPRRQNHMCSTGSKKGGICE